MSNDFIPPEVFFGVADDGQKAIPATLSFTKVRDVKSPTRGTTHSAGVDLFIPNDLTIEQLHENEMNSLVQASNVNQTGFRIPSHSRILIPAGVHFNIPEGFALIAYNKSGVATKKGLDIGACVVADTVIETNKGKFSAVTLTKEFITNNDILVSAYNFENKTNEFVKFDGFRQTHVAEVYEIEFDDGTKVVCNEVHQVLTNNGWQSVYSESQTDA
jgi:dUTPase